MRYLAQPGSQATDTQEDMLKFFKDFMQNNRPNEIFYESANFGFVLPNGERYLLCPKLPVSGDMVDTSSISI